MMKYLFYDVETANASKRGSICAVGWVQVVDNEIVDKGYTLIDPQCSFSVKNVEIHGITKAQVKGAPTFAQYWHSCLLEKVSGALIVSHNAIFDISATEQALANAGLQDPGLLYMDSLPVARRCLQMDHYRLSNLADEFGWQYHSHNALEDAEALAYVLLRLTARQGYDS
ncbi:exonuclease domain-containing protein, partial [Ralstonia pseudosolanacearum]|uniref:exonuclease domain-containing protein n=1 Tax=Ralstonia pseudosolanacearum TaxID=1310165 RepID=UPI003CFBA740